MRKIKIVNDGFLETADGHIVECPRKFKQCHTTCAWFHTIRVVGGAVKATKRCHCGEKLIGEPVTDEML